MSHRLPARSLTRRPTVTVVIPCYNYGHYVPFAVGSVLDQPGVDTEVILIDDASPDGSGEVVRRLAAADERIHPILHSQNRGHIATYNEGLAQARGDYVVLLSADDALPPGALGRAAALLDAHPAVGFAYGHPVVFADDPPPVRAGVRNWTIWPGREWVELLCRSGRGRIINPEVVMRTSVQHAIGGYDPDLPHSGDFEMWLRAAAISDVGRVNGSVQGFYRAHPDSMQRTTYAGHVIDLEGRLAAFEKLLVGPAAPIAGGAELFARAQQALARSALAYARSAYDHGRADAEPVAEYLAFAARVWPAARETRQWRALQRLTAGPGRGERVPGAFARRVAEDLGGRVRWRRWRWSGV